MNTIQISLDKCEDEYEATLSLITILYIKDIDEIDKKVFFTNILYEQTDQAEKVTHSLKENCLKCFEIIAFEPNKYKEYIDNNWNVIIQHHIKDYTKEFTEKHGTDFYNSR